MSIIPKKNIFPIMIPTKVFHDRWKNQDGFIEMNPTMYINPDGTFKILVRTVNYRKHSNRASITYGELSESIYHIIHGKIENGEFNLDTFSESTTTIEYNLQRYYTWWYGLEDIRFIDENTILACIPEFHENGRPCLFNGKIQDTTIGNFERCEPNTLEKNWMPFTHNGENKVIYTVSPFIIKSIIENHTEEVVLEEEPKSKLEGCHGSTNGIDLFGEKLFLIHKNDYVNLPINTQNIWLLYNPETKKITLSKPFIFFKYSFIEFPCSLSLYNNKVYVGLGINDNKAFIIELDQQDILKLFS